MSAAVHRLDAPIIWGLDRDALRDITPVLVGIAPFALLVGVTIDDVGIDAAVGLAGSGLIFAGSAQMAALTLLGSGAGIVTVLATVAVINARLLMYSTALEPCFRHQPAWFRWLGPHLLVDQTCAMASARPELAAPGRFRRYWLTAGAALATV